MQRIINTGEVAKQRMELNNIDNVEMHVIDAIFDSCQNIAKTAGKYL